MSVQTSWVSEVPAVNHSASYEIRKWDKMRVEATGRTETAENCIVSEARLIEPQDELLVEEAINGSSAAFGVLFERCERKVFHVARNTLRNREDADDAVRQAFERAYVHLKGFQGQSRFSTWLTRIAINEALMLLRKRRPATCPSQETRMWEKRARRLRSKAQPRRRKSGARRRSCTAS